MKVKINDWIKWWNTAVCIPSMVGVIASALLALHIYITMHKWKTGLPVSYIIGCSLMVFLVLGGPFMSVIYTACKIMDLPQKNISRKFSSLMWIRHCSFIPVDLVTIFAFFCTVIDFHLSGYHDNGIFPDSSPLYYTGPIVIFQILLTTVDEVLFHEIKDGEENRVCDETLIV